MVNHGNVVTIFFSDPGIKNYTKQVSPSNICKITWIKWKNV